MRLSFIYRGSHLQMFFNINILKMFAIFTRKHLCWSLFLIKLQAFRTEHCFYRTLPVAASVYKVDPRMYIPYILAEKYLNVWLSTKYESSILFPVHTLEQTDYKQSGLLSLIFVIFLDFHFNCWRFLFFKFWLLLYLLKWSRFKIKAL